VQHDPTCVSCVSFACTHIIIKVHVHKLFAWDDLDSCIPAYSKEAFGWRPKTNYPMCVGCVDTMCETMGSVLCACDVGVLGRDMCLHHQLGALSPKMTRNGIVCVRANNMVGWLLAYMCVCKVHQIC
jgi:hypothetical protein